MVDLLGVLVIALGTIILVLQAIRPLRKLVEIEGVQNRHG